MQVKSTRLADPESVLKMFFIDDEVAKRLRFDAVVSGQLAVIYSTGVDA